MQATRSRPRWGVLLIVVPSGPMHPQRPARSIILDRRAVPFPGLAPGISLLRVGLPVRVHVALGAAAEITSPRRIGSANLSPLMISVSRDQTRAQSGDARRHVPPAERGFPLPRR